MDVSMGRIIHFSIKRATVCLRLLAITSILAAPFIKSIQRRSAFVSLSYFQPLILERSSAFNMEKRIPNLSKYNQYRTMSNIGLLSIKLKKSPKTEQNVPVPKAQLNLTSNATVQAIEETHSMSNNKSLNVHESNEVKVSFLKKIFSVKKPKSNNSTNTTNRFHTPWENIKLERAPSNQTLPEAGNYENELFISLNEINLKIEKLQDVIKTQDTLIRQLSSSDYQRKQKELKDKVAPSKLFKLDFDKIKDTYVNPTQVALFSGFTGSIIGSILARSIARNLGVLGWFLCGCFGSYFGYIGSKYEAGGVIGNIMAYIGIVLSKKYNETTFLYRSGRLSYVYYQEFEKYDRKYKIMDKWKKFELFTQGKLKEAEKFEKRYEIMNRISSFSTGIVTLSFDSLQSAFNAKDRKDLSTKIRTALPYRIRKHFMTKKQRKIEREKKYRVKFCGQRVWPDFGEEII